MNKIILVSLLIGSAIAWPNWANDAGQSDASIQNDVNRLLEHISQHIPQKYSDLYEAAHNFDPVADKTIYKDDGEAVQHLVDEMHYHHLEQHHYFSLFNEEHRHEALMLFDVLMNCNDYNCFKNNAAYFREQLNEGVFAYAFYAAVTHSDLLRTAVLPALYEITPHMFVSSEIINRAYAAQMKGEAGHFYMPFTGSKRNPEQRVAYFGEDVGMNNHHVSWHIDFPFWWDDEKYHHHMDRKGELFYYMHHQLTARFDSERLSNHLDLVDELTFDDKIVEGFAPHTMYKYGGEFPSRPDNLEWEDVDGVARVRDMLIMESRIMDAIDHGYVIDHDGKQININDDHGVDILGDIIESSLYSPNVEYYGALHNTAHIMLGRQADPHGKYNMPPGVMEHFETATRDPTFFRLHKYMDNIFRAHKNSLPPYTKEELTFQGVSVDNVEIVGNLKTYFENFTLDINNAVDFSEDGVVVDLEVDVDRLNHEEFSYKFEVENNNGDAHLSTFRVFLCPRFDYNHVLFTFDEGRVHCIEVDKFLYKLAPGHNTVTRSSKESSVTIPDRLHFNELFKMTTEALSSGADFDLHEYKESCGIPNRMLLPRGTPAGMEFALTVAVTDGDKDFVGTDQDTVRYSHSLCGIHGEKYPDARPLGYPLDRKIPDPRVFLEVPNFHKTVVKVFHDEIHH